MKQHTYKPVNLLVAFFSLLLFLSTVAYLNLRGFIPESLPVPGINRGPQKEEVKMKTTFKRQSVELKNEIVAAADESLTAYEPSTGKTHILVETKGVTPHYPGFLTDGRIYFWAKDVQNRFKYLYIEEENTFVKYSLPLGPQDMREAPPRLSPDGRYLVFLSTQDAVETYYRQAIFRFDLKSLEHTKLTDNTIMSVESVFISPSSEFIGFTYRNIELNGSASMLALGVIVESTKTKNLFPKVQLASNFADFTPDSEKIAISSVQGVEVFDLTRGQVTAAVKTGKLGFVTEDNIVGVEVATDKPLEFAKTCYSAESELHTLPSNSLVLYSLGSGTLKKLETVDMKDVRFDISSNGSGRAADNSAKRVLVLVRDKDHCEATYGLLNTDDGSIQFLKSSLSRGVAFTPSVKK